MPELNAMEELAKASLMIRDLADGIEGTVMIETPAWDEISDPTEVQEAMERCKREIHQGQVDMALRGWHRAPDWLIDHMWVPNHHQSHAAWFFNDHEKKETRWITATFISGFGFRATFTNEVDRGARICGPEEIRYLAERYEDY